MTGKQIEHLRERARQQLRAEYPAAREALVKLWADSKSLEEARRGNGRVA